MLKLSHPYSSLRSQSRVVFRRTEHGFSLLESLVAGVLLASVLTAVGRMTVTALTTSRHQAERARIEAAINDNIQLLQMQDSYLQFEKMTKQEQETHCNEPLISLQKHLQAKAPSPVVRGSSQKITRNFEILGSNSQDILVVTYKFFAPGGSPKGSHKKPHQEDPIELRRIELNPNFSAACFSTEAL